MRKVEVKPYDVRWISMFKEEAQKLQEIFGSEVIAVHHIGSTSISGLKAKPIIDMMPIVNDIHKIDHFNTAMAALGYEAKGENGIAGRRYFQKGGDHRTHHVHIYEKGNPEIERHLAFRDYLRVHKEEATKYADLKDSLSKRYPYDIDSYIKGKEQMVLEIDRKAVEWYQSLK
jgi:GrpB-like predicted nucleotidyltransferase (UPF0157 family)